MYLVETSDAAYPRSTITKIAVWVRKTPTSTLSVSAKILVDGFETIPPG